MEKKFRYTLHPGRITSKNDGDVHFISYHDLIRLYRLRASSCCNAESHWSEKGHDLSGNIDLFPVYDGNYEEVRAAAEVASQHTTSPMPVHSAKE